MALLGSHCGSALAARAKFCTGCGAPLGRRCPNCQRDDYQDLRQAIEALLAEGR